MAAKLTTQRKRLSTVATSLSKRNECYKSMTQRSLLGFLKLFSCCVVFGLCRHILCCDVEQFMWRLFAGLWRSSETGLLTVFKQYKYIKNSDLQSTTENIPRKWYKKLVMRVKCSAAVATIEGRRKNMWSNREVKSIELWKQTMCILHFIAAIYWLLVMHAFQQHMLVTLACPVLWLDSI